MRDFPWWSDAQKKLQEEASRFTDEVLMPLAEKLALKKEYPWAAMKEMRKLGWFGATIPKQYGGRKEDWGVTGAAILLEECARAGECALLLETSLIGATTQILHDGSEEQKNRDRKSVV